MSRFFISIALLLLAGVGQAQDNPWVDKQCATGEHRCVTVASGETWESRFPDVNERHIAQVLNRQSARLTGGQQLIIPGLGDYWEQSPHPRRAWVAGVGTKHLIIFDPNQLAWLHYQEGELVRWGAAVGGKAWCEDVSRSCRTAVGRFSFTEAANQYRRSSVYPLGCAKKGGCARMPYFVRFTNGGQGMHKREFKGANASHGCVGVLLADIVYINNLVRALASKSSYGYFNSGEIDRVSKEITFVVLPYQEAVGTS